MVHSDQPCSIIRAATAGIRRIIGETLATNKKMLSLARKAGFVISESLGAHGVMRLEKTLTLRDHKRPCPDFEFVVADRS
jgi:hypothetical protein